MSGLPWGKFFWGDHDRERTLRLCSYAAQGLWMRMLCIAAESDGFVLVDGKSPTAADLAQMYGGTPVEVAALVEELGRRGVFSVDRAGAIYCRRMVRATREQAARAKGGRKGGRTTYEKQKGIFASQAPATVLELEADADAEAEPVTEKDTREVGADAPPLDPGIDFPSWTPTSNWQAWCEVRRKNRRPLTDAAAKLAVAFLAERRELGEDPAAILDNATRAGSNTLWPINRDDNRKALEAAVTPLSPTDIGAWVMRLRWYRFGEADEDPMLATPRGYWDVARCGPKPGEKNCRVPPEAQAEFARRYPPKAIPSETNFATAPASADRRLTR